MNPIKLGVGAFVAALFFVVFVLGSYFTVDQGERVVVSRTGAV